MGACNRLVSWSDLNHSLLLIVIETFLSGRVVVQAIFVRLKTTNDLVSVPENQSERLFCVCMALAISLYLTKSATNQLKEFRSFV